MINNKEPTRNSGKEILTNSTAISAGSKEKAIVWQTPQLSHDALSRVVNKDVKQFTQDHNVESSIERGHASDESDSNSNPSVNENKSRHKRSYSTSALKSQPVEEKPFTGDVRVSAISEFSSADYGRPSENLAVKKVSDVAISSAGPRIPNPKLKCRVGNNFLICCGLKIMKIVTKMWNLMLCSFLKMALCKTT